MRAYIQSVIKGEIQWMFQMAYPPEREDLGPVPGEISVRRACKGVGEGMATKGRSQTKESSLSLKSWKECFKKMDVI